MTKPRDRSPAPRCIAVVGMNGVGKSVFGKRLASKLGWKRSDIDRAFENVHGDHHAYIAVHGWEKFRAEEERIVLGSLHPDHVVVLGGGAIESPAVRTELKEKAIVIWIQAHAKKLTKHLKQAKVSRPEFTEGIHRDRVQEMLEARTPHYEDVADIVLFPSTPFARQVPVALLELQRYGVQEKRS